MNKKNPVKSKRALIKKLDTVFSLWIRNKYADSNGMVKCYTCNTIKPASQMQCGHFISRAVYATRWEPDNCKPQDIACNIYHQGQQYEFGKRLEAELGITRVEELRAMRHNISRFTISDYEDMIKFYSTKEELT